MNDKYELTNETIQVGDTTLYRIKALKDFGTVKAGTLGGFIECEKNLSRFHNAWVYSNARVFGNAEVYDNAIVSDNAEIYDNAEVYGNARVFGNAEACDNARVFGNAEVYGTAEVYGNARVFGTAEVYGNARVYDNAIVYGNTGVSCNAQIRDLNDILCIGPIGSRGGYTTVYRTPNGPFVTCGCFNGSLNEFEQKVKETHGNNKYAREYLALIDLAKIRFNEENDNG